MSTTADYLTQLQTDRDTLADNLTALGASSTHSETFTGLAPKVLNVKNILQNLDVNKKVTGTSLEIVNPSLNTNAKLNIEGFSRQDSIPLPNEYQKVNYIESDGNQYINTGVVPNSQQKYRLKYNVSDVITNEVIFGSRTSGTYSTSTNQIYAGNQVTYFYFYSGTNVFKTDNISSNTIYVENRNANSGNFDNTATQPIFLFALNNMGSPSAYATTKLYSFKIYDNNILVRDFVPCYRKSDNEIGLYDLVNNVFYTNQGTGEFSYGAESSLQPTTDYPMPIRNLASASKNYIPYNTLRFEIKKPLLPEGYQQVDYIRSSGIQWINTGCKPSENTTVEIKYYKISRYGFVYGSRTSSSSTDCHSLYDNDIVNDVYVGFSNSVEITNAPKSDSIHTFINGKDGSYFNNTLIKDNTGLAFTSDLNMYIFTINQNNTPDTRMISTDLYYCKIYDGNTLIRNFMPCYRKSDNEVGLYDLVNNVFYTNQGTGKLTYGNIVNTKNIDFTLNEGQKLYQGSKLTPYGIYNERSHATASSGTSSINIPGMKPNGEFLSSVGGTLNGTTITFDSTLTASADIEYELATPITNSYTNAQKEAYLNLTNLELYNGTNLIEVSSNEETNIELEYGKNVIEVIREELST